jgi:hypothetical protein
MTSVLDTPKHTAIFTIGRMNPPTSGHVKLIQTMMEANLALPPDDLGHGNVYIILSHSQNNIKDPLTCQMKRELLETKGIISRIKERNPALSNISVKIFCKDDPLPGCETISQWILKPICHIMTQEEEMKGSKPTTMALFIGEDRGDSYKEFLMKYGPRSTTFDFDVLPRPEGAMSATHMRNLVTDGSYEEFIAAVMDNGLNREDAEQLYADIDTALKPTVKKTAKTPKYTTPKVNTPIAAKQTTTRRSTVTAKQRAGRRKTRKTRKIRKTRKMRK